METIGICISNLGCKPGVVEVFDSMCTCEISIEVKEGIASIMCSSRAVIETIFPYVTQQVGSCDCGLFSLAYAHTICAREEPSTLVYSQTKLHKHFKCSIDSKQIKPFPSCLTQNPPIAPLRKSFRIYCTCRLPDAGDEMVQCVSCHRWYHYTCVGIPSKQKVKGLWFCRKCDK